MSVWLGALVKFVPAAVEPVLALVWVHQAQNLLLRTRRVALLLAVLGAVTVVLTWPWLDSPSVAGSLLGVAQGGQRFKDAWLDAPAAWLTVRMAPRLGVPDDPATLRMDVARVIVWTATRGLFGVFVGVEAWFLWRRSDDDRPVLLRCIALTAQRTLLAAILLYLSQIYAWYFCGLFLWRAFLVGGPHRARRL